MHLSLPLFSFTQWKVKFTPYSFTTKKLTHSMCQVSLVVKYIVAIFLQTVYDIETLLAGFNVQPIIGMNQLLN